MHAIEEPVFGISRRGTGGLNHLDFLNQSLLWGCRSGELPYESGRNSRRLALGVQFADFGHTSVLTGRKTDTVELPCATTSRQRPPPIQNTKISPVRARKRPFNIRILGGPLQDIRLYLNYIKLSLRVVPKEYLKKNLSIKL